MELNLIKNVKTALAETLQLNSSEAIADDARLKEDLGLDSMLSLTFLMTLEDNIDGFIVDAETLEAEHLISVNSVTHYVKNQLSKVKLNG